MFDPWGVTRFLQPLLRHGPPKILEWPRAFLSHPFMSIPLTTEELSSWCFTDAGSGGKEKRGRTSDFGSPQKGPLVAKEVLTQKTHDKFTHKNSIRQLLGYAPKVLCDYFLCFWWFLKKSWDYWVHLYTCVLDGHSLQWDNGQPYRIHILGTMPKAKHVNSTCSVKNREYSTFCRGGKYNMIGSLGIHIFIYLTTSIVLFKQTVRFCSTTYFYADSKLPTTKPIFFENGTAIETAEKMGFRYVKPSSSSASWWNEWDSLGGRLGPKQTAWRQWGDAFAKTSMHLKEWIKKLEKTGKRKHMLIY